MQKTEELCLKLLRMLTVVISEKGPNDKVINGRIIKPSKNHNGNSIMFTVVPKIAKQSGKYQVSRAVLYGDTPPLDVGDSMFFAFANFEDDTLMQPESIALAKEEDLPRLAVAIHDYLINGIVESNVNTVEDTEKMFAEAEASNKTKH